MVNVVVLEFLPFFFFNRGGRGFELFMYGNLISIGKAILGEEVVENLPCREWG